MGNKPSKNPYQGCTESDDDWCVVSVEQDADFFEDVYKKHVSAPLRRENKLGYGAYSMALSDLPKIQSIEKFCDWVYKNKKIFAFFIDSALEECPLGKYSPNGATKLPYVQFDWGWDGFKGF